MIDKEHNGPTHAANTKRMKMVKSWKAPIQI